MSDEFVAFLLILNWIMGVMLGYIIWAPLTPFKQEFLNGLSLKFLWGRFLK